MFTESEFYQRQTTLPEWGEASQALIKNAKVLVVGCGGLGSVAAVYLAASGVGTMHLIDFDVISVSNLHRQVFYKIDDIGKAKAEVLAAHIKAINPFVAISFSTMALSKLNVLDQFKTFDVIVDCTDSLPIKYLINDACVLLDKPLVYGSLYKFDGYVATFNALDADGNRTANLRDAFPEQPKNTVPNCAEAGTLNTIVGIIGLMQANEVLKLISKIGALLTNQLLIYNSLENSQFKMKLKPLVACHSERQRSISAIFETETYTDATCAIQDDKLLISAETLKEKLTTSKDNLYIISVNENKDAELPFTIHAHLPISKFNPNQIVVNPLKTYVMVCRMGITSYSATNQLKLVYPNLNVFSLKGGIEGL